MRPDVSDVLRAARLAGLELGADAGRFTTQLQATIRALEPLSELADGPAPPGLVDTPVDSCPPLMAERPDRPGADPLLVPPRDFAPAFSDGLFTAPLVPWAGDDEEAGSGSGGAGTS